MSTFSETIKSCDIKKIRKLHKVDWHCHCGRSGALSDVCPHVTVNNKPFLTLSESETWFRTHILPKYPDTEAGKLDLISATFKQFNNDNIEIACVNFGYKNIKMFGGLDNFIFKMDQIKQNYSPNTIILPELGIQRQCEFNEDELKSYIDSGFFYSIDINGNEMINPIQKFIPIYRYAENKGLVLKAHVGEVGTSDSIIEAITELHLSEIYHGISIVKSEKNLQFAVDNNIFFHVCPTSNYMLSVCENLKNHPIRRMIETGLNVSICSDDQLLFDSSISNEYLKLYQLNVLSLTQLEQIYRNSKKHFDIYREKCMLHS